MSTTNDETEQQRLRAIWEAHAAQAGGGREPSVLGMINTVKEHSPMHGTFADGGPVLGWDHCDVILASGCQSRRFFTRETIANEINVQWMNNDMLNILMGAINQVKAEYPGTQQNANH